MRKLIALGLLMLILGLLVACGGREPEDYYEPSPTPYEVQIGDSLPDAEPLYIPGFDHYEVSLTIDPDARTVYGMSVTTFTNRTGEPLETIVLRVFLNAFNEGYHDYPEGYQNIPPEFSQSIFRHGPTYGYMDIQYVTMNNEDLAYDLTGTVLVLYPAEPLFPGETVQLVLQYNAYIPMIAHRTGGNAYAMWFGMFLPVLAVFGEDGWVIPEYYPIGDPFVLGMASFEVEIITPVEYIVAGTGVTADEIILTDSRVTLFTANNVRSFAFAISPYFQRERVSTESGDVHLYYYTQGLPIDSIMEIVSIGMEYLSDMIGQYPFDHIRIIETDMFLSGVAFSNVIFMDTAALVEPDAQAIVMMLGRQWFTNIVGSNPVSESWLSKGLVRYITSRLFYDQPMGLRGHIAAQYTLLSGRYDLNLQSGLGAFDRWQDYYQTHHIKGMLMFYALNHLMGEELFWELVRQYFQTFYFQIATGADFIHLAEEIYGSSLEDFFREWFIGGEIPPLRSQYEGDELEP